MKGLILIFSVFLLLFAQPEKLKIKDINNSILVFANCDQVLYDPYQVKCYSYNRRSPLFNMYYLDSRVSKSIKKRLSFKEDKRIPKQYQNRLICYYKNPEKQDRGHLMPDASADFDINVLKTTYLTSNIVPEYYKTNRYAISKAEKEIRNLALKYHLIVITGVYGEQGRLKNQISCAVIPKVIYKIIFYQKYNKWYFLKVYWFKNGINKVYSSSKKEDYLKIINHAHILIFKNEEISRAPKLFR